MTLETYERPGRYQAAHAASRQGADRRQRPANLRALLRWAHAQYVAETPHFDYVKEQGHLDDDGTPSMYGPARSYLGLSMKERDIRHQHTVTCGPKCLGIGERHDDDWLLTASHKDEDGFYLTPLRRAIETLPRERRLLLRDIVPELLFPSDVLLLHGIPEWCSSDVLYQSLTMLWGRYIDRPLPGPGWLERSEAQQNAEQVA